MQNGVLEGPRGVLGASGSPSERPCYFQIDFSSIWGSILGPFWSHVGIKIIEKSIFGDSKRPPKLNTLLHGFQHRFLIDFGSILDLFLRVFCIGFGGRRHAHNIDATSVIFQIIFDDFRISSLH